MKQDFMQDLDLVISNKFGTTENEFYVFISKQLFTIVYNPKIPSNTPPKNRYFPNQSGVKMSLV